MNNFSEIAGNQERIDFFNQCAEEWDTMVTHVPEKLDFITGLLGLISSSRVLDVGTGTGVMIPYLTSIISPPGKIVALDYAEEMIKVAAWKFPPARYPQVQYLVQDIYHAPVKRQYDIILCYSCFPHFPDKPGIITHLARGLASGGTLMIAHSESREQINNMHNNIEGRVRKDFLPPMDEVSMLMESAGLTVGKRVDSDEFYIITGESIEKNN